VRNPYTRGMTHLTPLPPPVQLMDRIELARAAPVPDPRLDIPDNAMVKDEVPNIIVGGSLFRCSTI